MTTLRTHGLGSPRVIEYDESLHLDVVPGFQIVSRPLAVGMRGFDTSQKLTLEQYEWAKASGFDFAVRYAPLAGQNPAVGIDGAELEDGLSTGLGMMIVQFSRTQGLSGPQGQQDGAALITRCQTLGLPPDMSLWGDFSPADPATMKAYGNALYAATVAGGAAVGAFGGYNEPGVPSGLNLRTDYTFHRYWRTNGEVPEVEGRGYQLHQLFPGNVTVGPAGATFLIDYDFVGSDWLGSYPVAAFKA
jgi:hypothetical protein